MKKIIVFLLVIFIVLGIAYVLVKSYIFPIKYEVYVTKYARQYNLDEKLIYSVIKAESQFDSKATSKKNAIGLMQITEDTGKWLSEEMGFNDFSRDKLYDEEYNIRMGCYYIKDLLEEFKDIETALAAYNAGRGNVNDWIHNRKYTEDGIKLKYIPFEETKSYIDKINFYYKAYNFIY
ncbi:MAG: lytic transglycosylase domain-containing protein [Clostridium sp.]|nr:lytic transglycosylase domain-containing protein [Clostridium sp.]MDY3827535.1 lytic transglycosylase domain-containing protein [Clostridium sp.]